MSDTKKGTSRRDDEARVNAGHLTQGRAATEDREEDWGTMPAPAGKGGTATKPAATSTRVKDEDLERELENERDTGEERDELDEELDDEEEAPPQTARAQPQNTSRSEQPQAAPPVDANAVLQQLSQLQTNLPALIEALKQQKSEIGKRRDELNRKLDEEEAQVRKQLNLLLTLSGQKPLEDNEEEEPATPRRGRRGGRRRAASTGASAPAASSTNDNSQGEGVRRRGGTGKRFRNEMTLKEAIVEQMFKMPNYTGSVNEVTHKVITDGGYKTTSAKPTNTVRIQMYRLEEEQMVKSNPDGTYRLTKAAVNEILEKQGK